MSCNTPWSRRKALLAGATLFVSPALRAHEDWPLRSEARFRFLGLHVYDAKLLAPQPLQPERWAEQAFALELVYARELKGVRIAERSLDEMRRQGELAPEQAERWLAALKAAFPDVREGDRLRGVHEPQQGARFWHNGQPRPGQLDREAAARFFGIWLHPATSEPGLRKRLLGL